MGHGSTVQVIGHRGAAAHAPENTLASFRKAIEMGATMLELDVHLSKDNKVVVIHDHDIARTTSGSGAVSELTWQEISGHDAGAWMNPVFVGERIPLLSEVMGFIRQGIALNIEIKGGASIQSRLVDNVLALILEHDAQDMIVISSFHRKYLAEVRSKAPYLETAFLYAYDGFDTNILDEAVEEGWRGLHPCFPLVDQELMEGARQRGLAVRPWTVNRANDMERLIGLGVDGIVSDLPDVLKGIVTKLGL